MVSLNEPVGEKTELGHLIADDGPRPEDALDDGSVALLLRHLDPRERRVIQLRFGLSGAQPETQAETARRLRMRRSDVRRLEEYALRKLRLVPGLSTLAAA